MVAYVTVSSIKLAVANVVNETSKQKFFHFVQVKKRKPDLAKLETTDMGKPIQEAEWDMVRAMPYWFCSFDLCQTVGLQGQM